MRGEIDEPFDLVELYFLEFNETSAENFVSAEIYVLQILFVVAELYVAVELYVFEFVKAPAERYVFAEAYLSQYHAVPVELYTFGDWSAGCRSDYYFIGENFDFAELYGGDGTFEMSTPTGTRRCSWCSW